MVDSWQENAKDLNQDRIRQEHEDLNNEMAGRDTGRIKRFATPEYVSSENNKKDDNFIMEAAMLLLSTEQQRQLEQLNHQFELYDQATKNALADIDKEILLAQREYQNIQDNATRLDDGSRVYRDENNGHFYDEKDQRLSESDEIEAHQNFKPADSSRQRYQASYARTGNLHQEKSEVIEFQVKQDELQERLKENPEDAADIQDELDNLPMPERIQNHYTALSSNESDNIRNEVSTSAAKELFDDAGIKTELSLTPAFHHAGGFDQLSSKPDQNHEPNKISPQPSQGLTM